MDRRLERAHRRTAVVGDLRRVRAVAGPGRSVLVVDGQSEQPQHVADPFPGGWLGRRPRAARVRWFLRSARGQAGHWPAVHRVGRPARGAARRHQPRVLAPAVRGTARRAGQDVPGAQCHRDGDRRHAPGLHRRDQRPAAGLLAADTAAATRVPRHGSPARHATGQVDVAARLRTAEAGSERRRSRGAGQCHTPGQPRGLQREHADAAQRRQLSRRAAEAPVRRARRLVDAARILGLADGTARRRRRAAADRVCQSRQPAAGARRVAPDGDCAAGVTRRQPRPPGPPADHRSPRDGFRRRHRRPCRRVRPPRRPGPDAFRIRTFVRAAVRARPAGPGICRRRDRGISPSLRRASSLAAHEVGGSPCPQ